MGSSKCQHCGKREKTDANLAGYECSDCRPTCIACEADDVSSFTHNTYTFEGEEFYWCHNCGQILPPEHMNQDTPVDGFPDELDIDRYLGVTWEDVKEDSE